MLILCSLNIFPAECNCICSLMVALLTSEPEQVQTASTDRQVVLHAIIKTVVVNSFSSYFY